MKAKRIFSLILSAAMLLTGLSACKKDGGDVSSAGYHAGSTVYRPKRYTVSGAPDETDSFLLRDGRLYFRGVKEDNDQFKTFYTLNSCDTEGGDLKSVPLNLGDTLISKFDFDSEGNIVYVESDVSKKLKKIKPDGTAVSETDITSAIDGCKTDYFFAESVAVDKSGNIVVNGYFQLIVLDENGNYLFDISCDNGIRKLVKSAEGEVYAATYGGESYCDFYKIDMEKQDFGDNIDLARGYELGYNVVPCSGKGDADIYIDDGSGLYSFDLESGEKTEILGFVNSDIIKQEISDIIPVGDGGFIGVGRSYPAENMLITAIYPVDASTLPQRTEISVAGSEYSIGSMLEYQAVKFNTENEKYRIVIKKYSGEDYIQKLNNEMTAGRIPDILITDNQMPFDSYAAKGIFADLYEFIDRDDTVSRENFLPNLLTAMETDGKLYRFTDSFKIFTAVGKTSIFGSERGIDFKKINDIMANRPKDTEIFAGTTKENVLMHAMELCGDNFIDYKAGKCDFTSDYFIELLEFANGFLNSSDMDSYFDDDFWSRYNTMYTAEDALMLIVYITNFSDIFYNERQIFGEEVTAVGFPAFSGTGAAFDVSGGFAISEKSKNREGAWEFVRSLLTEDYQDGIEQLPVRKASLERKAQKNMQEFDKDAARITTIGNITLATSGNAIGDARPTQADVDKTMDIINSTKQICSYNSTVTEIVTEEAGAYFSGSKSAEAVAETIQDRVQNYLSEMS